MLKKIVLLIIVIAAIILTHKTHAATVPFTFEKVKPSVVFSDSGFNLLSRYSVKEIEKIAGRKLSFKEKIAVKLYKSNPSLYNKYVDSTEEKKMENKALWAKWLGIGSLIGLFVPGLNVLALPAATIAIVFGTATIDKVKNKKNSRQGITFGIITLAVILLLVLLVVIIVSSLPVR